MNTTVNTIAFATILNSDPSVEKLRWAISNEIHPSTELEVKLVGQLALHLRGLRDIPVIKVALLPWLQSLDHHGDGPSSSEAAPTFPSPRTDSRIGDTEPKLWFAFPGDFLLSGYVASDEGENGHVTTERAVLMFAFEAVFSGDLADTLSPIEAVHVTKYRSIAKRLWLLVKKRRLKNPIQTWMWESQAAAIAGRLSAK